MTITYMQGTHTRKVHTSQSYVAKAVALIFAMGYEVISVKY